MSKDQQELIQELFNQVWEEPKIMHLHPFHDLEQLKNILDTSGGFTNMSIEENSYGMDALRYCANSLEKNTEQEEIKGNDKIRTPNQIINSVRHDLVSTQDDVRLLIVTWASDHSRAATDISVNSLMEAHLHITEAIKLMNKAQRHTEG